MSEPDAASTRPAAALRHALIGQILAVHEVHSQGELVDLLEQRGYRATQATVSRDLAALGAERIHVKDGRTVYVLPQDGVVRSDGGRGDEARARLRQLSRMLVVSVAVSGNLVVLHTPTGAANYLASTIDQLHLDEVLGTIAGDDTILLIASDADAAARIEPILRPATPAV